MIAQGNVRFKPDHITNQLSLIALIVTHPSGPVEHLHACHPLVHGDFVLARKVMDVSDETAHDLSKSRVHIRTHVIDHMVCEIGVESIRHFGLLCLQDRMAGWKCKMERVKDVISLSSFIRLDSSPT